MKLLELREREEIWRNVKDGIEREISHEEISY